MVHRLHLFSQILWISLLSLLYWYKCTAKKKDSVLWLLCITNIWILILHLNFTKSPVFEKANKNWRRGLYRQISFSCFMFTIYLPTSKQLIFYFSKVLTETVNLKLTITYTHLLHTLTVFNTFMKYSLGYVPLTME